MSDFDIIIAGGGLAGGLVALRLAAVRPDLQVALVEGGERIGGNHIWSSFDSDISPAQLEWTAPLRAHVWDSYDVRFPGHSRIIAARYGSVTSDRLDAAVRAAVPVERLFCGVPVASLSPWQVVLADQRVLTAAAVIDARGQGSAAALDLRWQKFLGLEVELAADHGLDGPVIMDATVAQADGYRFVYTLPLGPRRVLIEDTYYSDGADLAPDALRARIAAYAAAQGWEIAAIVREEAGVLPIALGGDIDAFRVDGEAGVPRIGLRAAMFNPITGYSFPDAVRVADLIAALPVITSETLDAALSAHVRDSWASRRLYRMLNRMLFLAADPGDRYRILERFYRLDAALIGRFYAGRSTAWDWARILSGKPPIPISRAVATLAGYALSGSRRVAPNDVSKG